MRIASSLAIVLVSLVVAPAALAQDAHYQTFLVGERAQGLGGAFTGLADDPSAAFYNPAGLAHLTTSALSGSLSVNAYNSHEVTDGYGSSDLIHDDDPSVPIYVGLVKKFGRRDEERIRRHAVALSTLHPNQRRLSYSASLSGVDMDGMTVDDFIRIGQEEDMTWYGPSYAIRLSPQFALGISAFLSTRSLEHREDQTIVTEGMRQPDGTFTNASFSVRQVTTEVEAQHIVLRLGAQWLVTPQWRLGMMFQPPGIPIGASARIAERRVFYDGLVPAMPYGTFFDSDQSDLDAEYPIPAELRVGVAWLPSDDLTFALDVSIYSPVGSADDPVRMVGMPDPDPETGDLPQPGDFLPQSWHREASFNISMGMDATLFDAIPVRVGLFTNRSAAPSVPANTDILGVDDVDMFGASLSVGIRSGDYDVAIGASALYGNGYGYAVTRGAGPNTYARTEVEDRILYFFLSGAKRAASRLARAAYQELEEELATSPVG